MEPWSRKKLFMWLDWISFCHPDLLMRAKEMGNPHQVVHNASIMNAVDCCGLQLYNYGEAVSILFWTPR